MSNPIGRIDLAAKRKTVKVELPELGGHYTLRELSGGQVSEAHKAGDNVLAHQLAMAIVHDDTLEPIYDKPEDIEKLLEMSARSFLSLSTAMRSLNGEGKEAIEETVKNSEASESTDSGSV